jgi:DNA-binding beta-propeller fold protein YncE
MTLRKTASVLTAGAAIVLLAGSGAGPSVEEAFVATTLAAVDSEATMCMLPSDLQEQQGPLSKENYQMREGDITPVRMVFDPYPSFNGIALDPAANLVVLSDTNRKSLLSYSMKAAGAATAAAEPLRQIMGPETGVGFIAGVAVDPQRRELLTVNNDVEDRMVVFDYDDVGNVKPKRTLYVPHQSWGVALSRKLDQIVFSVQTPNMIVWYKRDAKGLEPPLRVVKGEKTGMADPHGVAVDDTNGEVFVANHGNWRPSELITAYTAYDARESRQEADPTKKANEEARGRFRLGSVTVFPSNAEGDIAPKRTIAGALTQLDWPMGITVDEANNEIAVASNGNDAILFFKRTADGNTQPTRVIRGARTGIKSPMGVSIHGDELWVANFGEHTALVFPRTAAGNVAPTRVLRNAPRGTPTTGIGNPYAVAFDTKRKQLLVPN